MMIYFLLFIFFISDIEIFDTINIARSIYYFIDIHNLIGFRFLNLSTSCSDNGDRGRQLLDSYTTFWGDKSAMASAIKDELLYVYCLILI